MVLTILSVGFPRVIRSQVMVFVRQNAGMVNSLVIKITFVSQIVVITMLQPFGEILFQKHVRLVLSNALMVIMLTMLLICVWYLLIVQKWEECSTWLIIQLKSV